MNPRRPLLLRFTCWKPVLALKRDAEPHFAGAHERESAESGEQELFYQLHAAELYGSD
jgi:hypothetical protein